MKQFKKTAIALGVAQIALAYGGSVAAQEASGSKDSTAAAVVVVTGQRAALQSAQKIKKDADEIVDSVVADDIGKLPDRSVTEVLQRIVGVTMDRSMPGDPQHFAMEGSGVLIRGLGYVRSELNGRESFSANGGRALNFEDVPPELMAGVDVYKNPSAEQTEGGISGLVNLRTLMPFDQKGFRGAVSAQGTYSTLRKGKVAPSTSLLLSNRWNTPIGEIGALIDVAKSESYTKADSMRVDPFYPRTNIEPGKTLWVPKGAMWRSQNAERERVGQYGALQWRPIRDLTTSLTYFKSKYHMTYSEQALLMQHTTPYDIKVANGVYDDQGVLRSGTLSDDGAGGINFNPARLVYDRDSSTRDLAWNTVWRAAPNLTFRADLQHIKSDTTGFYSEVGTGLEMQKENLDLTGSVPRVFFDASDRERMSNPNNYYWAYTMDHHDKSGAGMKALKLDADYEFDDPILRSVRFGVRLTKRNADTTDTGYNWQGVTQPWMVDWQIPHTASLGDPRFANQANLQTFDNFMGGKSNVAPLVFPDEALARGFPDSYAKLHSYHDLLCREKGGGCDAWTPLEFGKEPWMLNKVEERTKAFYTQLRFGFDNLPYPVDGTVGLRYVTTNSTSHGYISFNPPTLPTAEAGSTVVGTELVPIFAKFAQKQDFVNSYKNFLPSLNLRMKYSDTLQFRFAAARAISRPDFASLQGFTGLGETIVSTRDPATNQVTITRVDLGGGSGGNPMMKPVTSNQIDLSAEWYFSKTGSLTLALFNKQLRDMQVNQLSVFKLNDVNGQSHDFIIGSPIEGAKGYARGIELAYQQYYDKLPGWMSGFGTQANFTFVDSKRELYNPVFKAFCQPQPNQPNLNANLNGCDTDGRTFSDLPLQGLSRYAVNFAILYDKGPISARLAYNWRSKQLQGIGSTPVTKEDGVDTEVGSPTFGQALRYNLPLWASPYGQFDASIWYNVTEKFAVGLEGSNITNSIYKQTMQQHTGMNGSGWFVSGPRYTVQARYKF